jgi:hypothetical protein
MLRWLLAGSLVLGITGGGVSAGEETPSPSPDAGKEISTVALAAPGAAKAKGGEAKSGEAQAQPEKKEPEKKEPEKKGDEGKGEAKGGGEEEESKKPAPTGPWHFTGTVDFYWENNFNNPFNDTNTLRAFDVKDADGPHMGLAEISILRDRKPWGFRLVAVTGNTADLVNATEPLTGGANEAFEHILQVYAGVNLNKKGTTYVEGGKFVTGFGTEVIEPRDNYNYSRSLLFNFAIPFYHLGGRAFHYFNTTDFVRVDVSRGWNNVGARPLTDNIGVCVMYNRQVSKKLSVNPQGMISDEPDFVGIGHSRYLAELNMTYVASPKWTFVMNGDYWHQPQFLLAPAGPAVSANVGGLCGYARRTLNKKQALTLRAEFLSDPEGAAGTGAAQTIWETTLTFEHRWNKYAVTRLEYRHDSSDVAVFPKEVPGAFAHGQDTLGASLILSY